MTMLDLVSGPAAHAAAPATILFGLDDKQKNHASWFNAAESEGAVKAAALMGMATLPVSSSELSALAEVLPHGKLFDSGKAFVPFVKQPLFDKLAAHLPDRSVLAQLRANASAAEAANRPAAKTYTYPKDRSMIVVGNLVLANDGPGEGWWEASVEAVTGEMLTLLWRDWPEEEKFVRQRDQVGLLPTPKSTAN